MNRPVDEEPWQGDLNGLSYSAWRQDPNTLAKRAPTIDEIKQDLQLIAGKARSIRTYESTGVSAEIPALASAAALQVTAGAWIDTDPKQDELEVQSVIRIANKVSGVNRIIVGNETQLHNLVSKDDLIHYIREVKAGTELPVSTAEPFHIWLDPKNADLANEVDFIAVHILPFWNGVPADKAVDQVVAIYNQLHDRFPDKPILIAEVGWPSEGLTRVDKANGGVGAVASPINQGLFLRKFLVEAKKYNLDYNIIEAFDEPWKINTEGGVGAYWGIWNADRKAKPALQGILVNYANWKWLALATIGLGLPFALWMMRGEFGLTRVGRFFVALLGCGGVMVGVWVYADYSQLYLTWVDILALVMIAPAILLLLVIFLVEGLEMAVNLWLGQTQRRLAPPPVPRRWKLPKVSVHVPCYNEPPEMMIETIKALERLQYPDFEVLIIDNNTKDDAVWKPVEAYIASLGRPNFRFFHLPKWPGFKAGALNYGLTQTHPDAEVIATIDSDYLVRANWLSDLAPHFADPTVALVQAPQDYRDGNDDLFKRMCFWEYAGFFYLGMKTRDEKNAIIQHGTMALIRRSALVEAGGWAEWCITEDAELGLRLFEAGHRAVYTEKSYGKGLMPDSFVAYRKQRYRWAYGAMMIMKRHWRELLPFGKSKLHPAQRYQFLAGWLPWIADGLQLSFILLALVWTAGMILAPNMMQPPLTLYLIVTLGMFFFKVGKSVWLYSQKVPCGFLDNVGASLAGLALSYSVAKAVWRGAFTNNLPFHRTPKMENAPALVRGFVDAWEETLIAAVLIGSGLWVAYTRGAFEPAAMLWAILLFVQSLPFVSALIMSMIAVLPLGRKPEQPLPGIALGATELGRAK
ncbi:MAG TPA: glycosyltransferase family 2 protein [Candidatus Binatia bacterium]|nr:glycosyltransferase family 2 protein [Candidatus Binatia bacterium]